MSNPALLVFQQIGNEGSPGPYTPDASQWWGWVGVACFLVGIVGFSLMGLSG